MPQLIGALIVLYLLWLLLVWIWELLCDLFQWIGTNIIPTSSTIAVLAIVIWLFVESSSEDGRKRLALVFHTIGLILLFVATLVLLGLVATGWLGMNETGFAQIAGGGTDIWLPLVLLGVLAGAVAGAATALVRTTRRGPSIALVSGTLATWALVIYQIGGLL